MIRCNNCGWFNPNSAKRCEMCDEELTGLPIENPIPSEEESDSKEEDPRISVPAQDSSPIEPNTMMETVRLEEPVKVDTPPPSLTQTVLDASAVIKSEEPIECPKCRYPVFGYADTCPNCGATLKRTTLDKPQISGVPSPTVKEPVTDSQSAPSDTPESAIVKGTVREMAAAAAVKADSPVKYARETVREIPDGLISNKVNQEYEWCLIPVESPDSETIYMRSGDIIRIGNRSYKFSKR